MATKKICVVGAGRWGKNHVRTLHQLGALGGVVESSTEAQSQIRADFPGVEIFSSVDESFEKNFDGYTVATPAETHAAIATTILRRRKPVLVEKPLAISLNEARTLAALARENQTLLMVGHVMLFHPAIRKMKELIASGKIGKLQYLYSNRVNLGTVRTEENILWSFAPHDISIFQFLIGSMPRRVTSRGAAFLQPSVHDTTITVLEYPENIVAHNFVSWLHPFKEHRLVVIGSKGMLSYEDSSREKQLLFYEKGIDWVKGEPISRDGPTESIPFNKAQPLQEELSYFISNLNAKEPLLSDYRNGLEVLEILEQATSSLSSETTASSPRSPSVSSANQSYFVHESSYVDQNVSIGAGTKIWHFSHIQSNSSIGTNCSIGQNVNVANNVRIGNHVKIQNNVSVYEGVELEDYVFCGPSSVFTNVTVPRSKYPQRGSSHYSKTLVREGASIGANATIVCGNTIGRNAFIAAGSVVTKDVPDYAVMKGVPARQAGWMCECGEQLPLTRATAACPRCKREYELKEGLLVARDQVND